MADWNNSLVKVAVGIITNQNKILVCERPRGKPYSGYWEFPGGKIEANESPEIALTRELKEELDIDVITARHWFSHTHAYPDKTVLLTMWLVSEFQGEPKGLENQVFKWVSEEELLQLKILEGNLMIIDKIKGLFQNPS